MSFNEWIKEMWSIYKMEYYSAIRKNDYPTFVAIWMGLKEIMLSEISRAEKDNYHISFRTALRSSNCTTRYLPKDTDVVKRRGIYTPVFIAALSTIAKSWKELRCPSTDDWIKKFWSIYTMEYYSAIRKNHYTTFAATWTALEEIMLSEISRERQLSYIF